eukprot:COSAG02_NODE_7005_length_3231_cov_1.394317_2_plen_92_part_00
MGGTAETLSRYHQRFRDLLQEVEQDFAAVPLATEFQLRILYVSGLPTELQAYVISDPKHAWYDPQLSPKAIEDFYERVEAEGRRRDRKLWL